ncbi:MAG: hypothetical protein LBI39_02700 [Puniceicoccales bacterium]|jgi:hypothetical protein|nr:hypothetical protein [Puniceicoccales bacterium]
MNHVNLHNPPGRICIALTTRAAADLEEVPDKKIAKKTIHWMLLHNQTDTQLLRELSDIGVERPHLDTDATRFIYGENFAPYAITILYSLAPNHSAPNKYDASIERVIASETNIAIAPHPIVPQHEDANPHIAPSRQVGAAQVRAPQRPVAAHQELAAPKHKKRHRRSEGGIG